VPQTLACDVLST